MIVVNTPGSWSHIYAPLRHAEWHGCTPTDLVFPFFLFIVGVAMAYSLSKFEQKITLPVTGKILKRVAVIFCIGLFLNAFPFTQDVSQLRILGVLQRIALAYGIAAFLCLAFKPKQLLILSGAVLLGYWGMLAFFGSGDPYAIETNVVRMIDLKILGENHLWRGHGIAFDPEGLLSTLPAVVTVMFGYLTGMLIHQSSELKQTILRVLLFGIGAIVAGKIWGLFFPINKALWTSSYVLYTAGLALVTLGVLLWLIDLKGIKKWTFPFVVFGMNPLFLYVLAGLWVKTYIYLIRISQPDGSTVNAYSWLYNHMFHPIAGDINGSLLFALFHVFLFWLILLVLYRRQIFIKI